MSISFSLFFYVIKLSKKSFLYPIDIAKKMSILKATTYMAMTPHEIRYRISWGVFVLL
jgi:hypothetical protein